MSVPPWAVMWVLAGLVFAACKTLTCLAARNAWSDAHARRRLLYVLAWPGLDATAFLAVSPAPPPPTTREWRGAAGRTLVGIAVLWGCVRLVPHETSLAQGWLGMAGIVTTLHFGVFHLLSCAYRAAGIRARPLMRAPLGAKTLADLWANRWNTAFRDFTHRHVFVPLRTRTGNLGALVAGFALSGLLHDLVISVPAGGGFGLPTLYFLLQAGGILVERSPAGRMLRRGVWGRVFALLLAVPTACILFHPPFVEVVLLPFLDVIRAR